MTNGYTVSYLLLRRAHSMAHVHQRKAKCKCTIPCSAQKCSLVSQKCSLVAQKCSLVPMAPETVHRTHFKHCSEASNHLKIRMYLWWSLCTLYLHACQVRVTVDIPLVEFMYLVFTYMPGELLWIYLWWSLCTLYLHACQVRVTVDIPLVEFMYLVFTYTPGVNYCR